MKVVGCGAYLGVEKRQGEKDGKHWERNIIKILDDDANMLQVTVREDEVMNKAKEIKQFAPVDIQMDIVQRNNNSYINAEDITMKK